MAKAKRNKSKSKSKRIIVKVPALRSRTGKIKRKAYTYKRDV